MTKANKKQPYDEVEERYQAVVCRDQEAVGHFYYGVLSTGIYCRPDCSSRQPLAQNIRFFDTTSEAESAGFRACKRCKPDQATPISAAEVKVARICQLLESSDEEQTLDRLAQEVAWSPTYLQRTFKQLVGLSPKQYSRQVRIHRVQSALSLGANRTQAIYDAGFSSTGHYYTEMKKMGVLKAEANPQTAQIIYFRIVNTALGFCLMASTEEGICAVSLGDDEEVLRQEFVAQFSKAERVETHGDGKWRNRFDAVLAHVEGESPPEVSLPLDVQGTLFQRQVWQALRNIPLGETRTYSDIAQALEKPNAVRAVATACASNKIALLIPCHRVVRKGGLLAGYRWGLERKKTLLEREAEMGNTNDRL